MFDKSKRQKQQKAYRTSLRMLTHLAEKQSATLIKHYPDYLKQNVLKVTTCLHINYLVFSYLQGIQKTNQIEAKANQVPTLSIRDVKVGIIGGGVMGRLVLNSLLVLHKEGLEPANISLSTRQFDELDHYRTMFKVNLCFDNAKLAEESDILIVTVPATLDNWVIADLREPLRKRATYQPNMSSTMSSLSSNKNSNDPTPTVSSTRAALNPLVYITTSNMTEKKLEKLFQIPILTPIIRGEEQGYLNQLISYLRATGSSKSIQEGDSYGDRFHIEQIQKYLAARIMEKSEKTRQALFHCFQKCFYASEKQKKQALLNKTDRSSKMSQASNDKKQKAKSNQSSLAMGSGSIMVANGHLQMVKNLVSQILVVNQTVENTFLVRSRKWRMSYNNFIA